MLFRSSAAALLGVAVHPLRVREAADFEGAFETFVTERMEAVLVVSGSVILANHARVAGLAAHHRLPAMYFGRGFVEAGGLMSYGPSNPAMHRRAAYYVDRILKGAKPADLPIEQPMTFDFVVNMKTARELGITFPNEIMLQVTEVIE